jgi:hypothetical protein
MSATAACAGERPGQVDGDHAVPLLGGDVEHRDEALDAGAGHEDVDWTARPDLFDTGAHR